MPATSKCVVYVATHCVGMIATLDPLCNLGRKVYTTYYLLNSFHKSGCILFTYICIYIYDFENEMSAMLTFFSPSLLRDCTPCTTACISSCMSFSSVVTVHTSQQCSVPTSSQVSFWSTPEVLGDDIFLHCRLAQTYVWLHIYTYHQCEYAQCLY